MKSHTGVVNAAELRSLRINPDCPMDSEREIKNWPLDVQFGDDRIERSHTGAIRHWFHYYSPEQTRCRELRNKYFGEQLAATMPAGLLDILKK